MAPATRVSRVSDQPLPPVGPSARSGSKTRRASDMPLTTSGLDLATKLRTLERAVRSRVDRREALVDILRAVNTTLEPAKIADQIVERAASWIPAPCWAIVSADLAGELSVLADRGLEPDMGPTVYKVAAWVMQRGQDFVSADVSRDSRVRSDLTGAVIAFPLSCRGRKVGAILGLDRIPSKREPKMSLTMQRAVRLLLEPASVALDNALLLQRAQELSVTDDLTHLYNSRYLNQVLRREAKRASRSGRPLSLLFIDLDGFKAVNDTHGHLYGSRALVEAAAVIRGSARETDVVSRFGGDEFALVLPDTGAEGAYAVGARIRERLAAHPFLADEGLNIHLSCSVGVATLPDVAASAEELMHAADKAMYGVKETGKNGIQAAVAPADI
ncbi:MAG TPA: sensor domain-containing diguanylate cyclase [Vicinamibacterales bacterium]|nr:sensor domain-containing diguanylate cyclase [Vicinamibacterales bacterium]